MLLPVNAPVDGDINGNKEINIKVREGGFIPRTITTFELIIKKKE